MTAKDRGGGKQEEVTITNDRGRLTDEEIERMVQEAADMEEHDAAIKARIDAKNQLEALCYQTKTQLGDTLKEKLSSEDQEKLSEAIKETLTWVQENGDSATTDELTDKRTEFEQVVHSVTGKMYGDGGAAGATSTEDEDLDHDEL